VALKNITYICIYKDRKNINSLKKNTMKKHIYILGLVLTGTCLISSFIFDKDLFTICGWFSATMGAFSTLLCFATREMEKKD
jgi:hypothetical protein